jgi:hypothetical protein
VTATATATVSASVTLITVDAINDLPTTPGAHRIYAVGHASGASYLLTGATTDASGERVAYGRSERTGQLVRVVAGRLTHNGERLQVRIEFATDTGDLAGTVAFRQHNSMRGYSSPTLLDPLT